MKLGIDFDNTIINYSKIFKKVGVNHNLLTKSIKSGKNIIKNFFIHRNLESKWTELQGIVYGKEIYNADAYKNCKKILIKLNKNKIKKYIVSHKTLYPYIGEKINLHKSASNWLRNNSFFEKEINFKKNEIFFKKTIKAKIEKIISLRCTHFIDDLKHVLDILPDNIIKIHFNNLSNKKIY